MIESSFTTRSVAVARACHEVVRLTQVIEANDAACVWVPLLGDSDRVRKLLPVVGTCGIISVDVEEREVKQPYLIDKSSKEEKNFCMFSFFDVELNKSKLINVNHESKKVSSLAAHNLHNKVVPPAPPNGLPNTAMATGRWCACMCSAASFGWSVECGAKVKRPFHT